MAELGSLITYQLARWQPEGNRLRPCDSGICRLKCIYQETLWEAWDPGAGRVLPEAKHPCNSPSLWGAWRVGAGSGLAVGTLWCDLELVFSLSEWALVLCTRSTCYRFGVPSKIRVR